MQRVTIPRIYVNLHLWAKAMGLISDTDPYFTNTNVLSGEFWEGSWQGKTADIRAIFENGANIVSSPEGIASILASFWAAPARAAAANPALQNAIAKKTLQLIGANSALASAAKISVAGMGWSGTGDFLDQNINMANGMQEAFDKERWDTSTVLGGLIPGTLVLGGKAVGKAFGKNKFFCCFCRYVGA